MKYYSDLTKKMYPTEEECAKAEKELSDARAKAKEEHEKLVATRKARAAEVEDARKTMIDAQDKYEKILGEFLRDYKTYHYSTSNTEDVPKIFKFLEDNIFWI